MDNGQMAQPVLMMHKASRVATLTRLRWCLGLLLALAVAGSAQARTITWQDAVARLAVERTRAETCVALLKKHGDPAAISHGELAYGQAKAEIDGVIAGLVTALVQDQVPDSLPDLQTRLERGVAANRAFCTEVSKLLPETTGERNLIIDLVGAAIPPLIEAVTALYQGFGERDRLTRQTIQTQLEATQWPDFAAVTPSD